MRAFWIETENFATNNPCCCHTQHFATNNCGCLHSNTSQKMKRTGSRPMTGPVAHCMCPSPCIVEQQKNQFILILLFLRFSCIPTATITLSFGSVMLCLHSKQCRVSLTNHIGTAMAVSPRDLGLPGSAQRAAQGSIVE